MRGVGGGGVGGGGGWRTAEECLGTAAGALVVDAERDLLCRERHVLPLPQHPVAQLGRGPVNAGTGGNPAVDESCQRGNRTPRSGGVMHGRVVNGLQVPSSGCNAVARRPADRAQLIIEQACPDTWNEDLAHDSSLHDPSTGRVVLSPLTRTHPGPSSRPYRIPAMHDSSTTCGGPWREGCASERWVRKQKRMERPLPVAALCGPVARRHTRGVLDDAPPALQPGALVARATQMSTTIIIYIYIYKRCTTISMIEIRIRIDKD